MNTRAASSCSYFTLGCGFAFRVFTTFLAAAALLVSCTATEPDEGRVYRSEQEYRIGLSPQWLVVSRLEHGQKEIPIATENPRIRSLFTAEVLKALHEKARASGVELFLNLETSDETFIESINVQTVRGSIAGEEIEVGHACAEMEKRLTALYNEPVKIRTCKTLKIYRMPAIVMEYQVEKPPLAYVQYLIQFQKDRYNVMTLTCRPANLPKLRPEIDAIAASLRPL
ncbi:MAG TPA: hypothetical protein VMB77_05625 [Syntrophales bacterium]|nr:hypothetical protein [Syntrophales bacterium]